MTTLTIRQTDRLVHRTEATLTVAIILGAVEVIRRMPRWMLMGVGLLAYAIVLLAVIYIWWIIGALAIVIAWKLGRGFIGGWREA
jgi:hypothetical protein